MRRTNEEFQEEVFRRSAVYRKKMQKRRRIGLSTAAACLLIAVSSPLWFRANTAFDNAEQLTDGGVMDDFTADNRLTGSAHQQNGVEGGYTNSESDTAVAEENAAEESSIYDEESPQTVLPTEAATQGEQGSVPSHAHDTDFQAMTNEELWQYYGIAGLPEQILGYTRVDDRTQEYYNYENGDLREPGLHYIPSEGQFIIGDENIWVYTNETGQAARVHLMLASSGDDDGILYAEEPTGEAAYFTGGTVFVYVESFQMAHADIETFAEELYSLLQEELS